MFNQMVPHYVIVCVHMYDVYVVIQWKKNPPKSNENWDWCIYKIHLDSCYLMVGLAPYKTILQYGHLFAQFYGRNAKPMEFGFIVGD